MHNARSLTHLQAPFRSLSGTALPFVDTHPILSVMVEAHGKVVHLAMAGGNGR
jgi:hypothetical protein